MASSSDNRYEVGSNSTQGLVAVTLDGNPVHQYHLDAIEKFRKAGAIAAARLFAEPDLSVSSVSGRSFYSWLSWTQGPPRSLNALSEDERSFLLRGLSEQVEGLRAIAKDDPYLEGFLQAALVTPDRSCLMELEMRPLLVNWGLVGTDVPVTALDDHFQSTIGGLLEVPLQLDATRIGLAPVENWQGENKGGGGHEPKERKAGFIPSSGLANTDAPVTVTADSAEATNIGKPSDSSTAAQAAADPIIAQASAQTPGAIPVAVGAVAVQAIPFYTRAWFFPLLALLIALLVLLYLLWPGNLIYAARIGVIVGPSSAIVQESNAALSQRVEQLQTALADTNSCAFDPALLRRPLSMPPILPADGNSLLSPGSTADPDKTQGAGTDGTRTTPASPDSPKPKAPSEASASSQPTTTQVVGEMSLLETMDQATVFVIGETTDGLSTGSGFFVDPRTIITNAHVIDSVVGNTVLISNNHIGLQPAQIIAKNGGQIPGDADFALLRTEADMDIRPMQVSSSISRLLSVIAAGYPSFVTQGDEAYQQALDGDAEAFKRIQLVVTQGNVTSVQTASAGSLIAHTAQTSPGNSGGPLVDECGRVVGVNTFVRSGSELNIHLNFALSAESLFKFASAQGISLTNSRSNCAPVPVAAASPSEQP